VLLCIGNGFSYFGIIRCVFEFSLGIGVFAVTSNPKFRSIISGQKLLLLALLLVVICPLAGLADFWFIPLVFVLVLIGLLSFRGWVHRVLEHKVLVYLGEISYSVYLVHYFVKDVMVKAFLETVQSADLVWVFANVVVTLGLSALTYHWVEMPSRRFLVSRIK